MLTTSRVLSILVSATGRPLSAANFEKLMQRGKVPRPRRRIGRAMIWTRGEVDAAISALTLMEKR